MLEMIELSNAGVSESERIKVGQDGEIRPGDSAPALAVESGIIKPVAMRWGFPAKEARPIINARSEDIQDRVMFRNLTQTGRCALPAFGYFEWRRADGMKYRIVGSNPIYLAGLYRFDENDRRRFVILTRDAVGEHRNIHHRMPLVLTSRLAARQWLGGAISPTSADEFSSENLVIQPVGAEQMMIDFAALV